MEEKGKISGFFRNIMSVDETRVSVLMLSLIASLFFGGYMYLVTGTLSTVWADIITTLILAVTGINAINSFTSAGGRLSILNSVVGENVEKKATANLNAGANPIPQVQQQVKK